VLGSSRQVTSRHASSPCILTYGKVVTCRARRTARRNTLVTTSANATGVTRTTRVKGRRHSVDWGGHVLLAFPEVIPEIDANPKHKRLNSYTQALLLLRRPPCWNKHGATRTTSATRSSSRARHVTTRHAIHIVRIVS